MIYLIREHSDLVNVVNKQEVVKILTNFSKFEESREKLIRGTAKLEQMNWSNIFGMLLCHDCNFNIPLRNFFYNANQPLLWDGYDQVDPLLYGILLTGPLLQLIEPL